MKTVFIIERIVHTHSKFKINLFDVFYFDIFHFVEKKNKSRSYKDRVTLKFQNKFFERLNKIELFINCCF